MVDHSPDGFCPLPVAFVVWRGISIGSTRPADATRGPSFTPPTEPGWVKLGIFRSLETMISLGANFNVPSSSPTPTTSSPLDTSLGSPLSPIIMGPRVNLNGASDLFFSFLIQNCRV